MSRRIGQILPLIMSRRSPCITIPAAVLWLSTAVAQDVPPASDPPDEPADGLRAIPVVLTPRDQATLSAEVDGRITQIHCEFGGQFDIDQPLLTLDRTLYEAALARSEGQVRAAEAELTRCQLLHETRAALRKAEAIVDAARAQLSATTELHRDGHTSHQQLAEAQRDLIISEADRTMTEAAMQPQLVTAQQALAIAQSDERIARHQLEACRVTAPFAGRVVRLLAQEHEWVRRGQPLIEIVSLDPLVGRFLLPSDWFDRIHIDQSLNLHLHETGRTVSARIWRISAVLDAASETFEVHALIDNPEGALRPGMTAELNLSAEVAP